MTTDSARRIQVLDVLRGLALAGMFVVHFHMKSSEPGGFDDLLRTLIWRLVEGKAHGTFALLFGAGFALLLRRAETRGRPFAGFYLRRLAVLACFGFAAHAFVGYNVLLGYAVWGVPLLLLHRWSTRALIVTAVMSAASVPLYYLVAPWMMGSGVDVNRALEVAEAQGRYSVLLAARLEHMRWFHAQPFFFLPGATLTLFITGLLLLRHGVFENPLAHVRLLAGLALYGVVSWLGDNWVLPALDIETSLGLLRDQGLTFTYVSGALLFLARAPQLLAHLQPVANAGRMALTNYLVQIAALDLLFSGYALNLGQVRPIAAFPMALACFSAEVLFSTVWLKYFRFGPAEWLWRSLTYGRRQPMRQPAQL
jgi:uncharacterized protein